MQKIFAKRKTNSQIIINSYSKTQTHFKKHINKSENKITCKKPNLQTKHNYIQKTHRQIQKHRCKKSLTKKYLYRHFFSCYASTFLAEDDVTFNKDLHSAFRFFIQALCIHSKAAIVSVWD